MLTRDDILKREIVNKQFIPCQVRDLPIYLFIEYVGVMEKNMKSI